MLPDAPEECDHPLPDLLKLLRRSDDDTPALGAETCDVVPQLGREVRRVGQELVDVVARRVVEGEAGGAPELCVGALEAFALEFRLPLENGLLAVSEDAIETAVHGEWQDDVLVLAALEGVADEVRDSPEEADDFAVVHVEKVIPSRSVVNGLSNVSVSCS